MKVSIPYLTPQQLVTLARGDADYTVPAHRVNIAAQTLLATATFEQLQQLTDLDLEISEDNFIRIWRSLLLKRSQDVFEKCRRQRPNHYLRVSSQLIVPAPLGDLLYSLGRYFHAEEGVVYETIPPNQADPVENWWQIESGPLQQWIRTCNRMKTKYLMRETPLSSEYDGKPIMLASQQVEGDIVTIKTKFNTLELPDGLIAAVNEPLYENPPFAFANSHIVVVEKKYQPGLVAEYVGSYVTDSAV